MANLKPRKITIIRREFWPEPNYLKRIRQRLTNNPTKKNIII